MSASSESHYYNGFAGGLSVRGAKILNTYSGKVFWVDGTSGVGSDSGNKGITPEKPFATIDRAINECITNRGDVIMVSGRHTETVAAASGIALDKNNISIVGCGTGDKRPTITFATAKTATMVISGSGCLVDNMIFVNGIDDLTTAISITGAGNTLTNIETRDNNASYEADDFITAAATAARLTIDGWEHRGGGKTGAQTAGSFNGTDDLKIHNFRIYGDFAVAGIENVTDEWLRADIANGTIENYLATPVPCIALDANATGMVRNVQLRVDSGQTFISRRAKMNWYNVQGASGDGLMAHDVSDSWYYTTNALHFSADTSLSAFDITGDVELIVWGETISAVTSHADKISLGVSGAGSSVLSGDGGSAWNVVGSAKSSGAPVLWTVTQMDPKIVLNGENITATSTANITAGGIQFTAKWRPISSDGLLVAA